MEKKNLYLYDNYMKMSEAAAGEMVSVVKTEPEAAIVIATGHSPLLAYRIFAERVKRERIDVSGVTWIKLDEWLGLPSDNPATCEFFIRREILEPLGICEEKYLHYRNETDDPEAECRRVHDAYMALPKVDLVILGIGMDGHVGLNEPSETLYGSMHLTGLHEKTKTHELLTHTEETVTGGVTLGFSELFRGKEILLLADGSGKEEGLRAFLSDELTTALPVSLLKLHENVVCMVNQSSFSQ